MSFGAGRLSSRSHRPAVAGVTPSIAATSRCSRPRSRRHAFNRSPSVRGGLPGLVLGAVRRFRHSGNMANNREGFREAVTAFVLADS
jgi:hypothetical protein